MSERIFVRLAGDPLYAPETSIPRGTLRELRVPGGMGSWVAHVTAYAEQFPGGGSIRERVLPSGSVHLIFGLPFDLDSGNAPLFVAGPTLRPATLSLRGNVRGLSVRLRPGAAPALFRASAHEFAHRAIPWDEVVPNRYRSLPDQLQDACSDDQRASILGDALRAMLRQRDTPEWSRTEYASDLLRSAGRLPLHAAARRVGMSERRVQQLFRLHVGLPPSAWRRVTRFHDCLRLLRRQEPTPWALVAAECGFSDQSHLTNEFQALAGMTPTQFLTRRGRSPS